MEVSPRFYYFFYSEMAINRLMNNHLSPSKKSRMKNKRKSKRVSMEFEALLRNTKEQFRKVSIHTFMQFFQKFFASILLIFYESFHRLLIELCHILWTKRKRHMRCLWTKSKVEMQKTICVRFRAKINKIPKFLLPVWIQLWIRFKQINVHIVATKIKLNKLGT